MQSNQQQPDGTQEKMRRLLVTLVFTTYWLAIFEGALRKWVFPGLGTLLYFIKDPFVLLAYVLAFKYGLWPKRDQLVTWGWILAAVYFLLALEQVVVMGINPLLVGYGLRNYFWYIPLAFLIGENFQGKDLARLVRQTLLVSIPIAALVYYQYRSPPYHWVNRYVAAEYEPTLVGQVVRTCGTFSYLTGQMIFVSSTLPMLFLIWLVPRQQCPVGLKTGIVASFAVLVNFLLNGSRMILFYGIFTIAAAGTSVALLARRINFTRLLYILAMVPLICAAAAIIMINFFPDALQGQYMRLIGSMGSLADLDKLDQLDRMQPGQDQPEIVGRLNPAITLTITAEALQSSPMLGWGLGVGSSGGSAIASGQRGMILSESEWPRIIEESGVIGILYIGYRLLFVGWLWFGAIEAVKRSTNPLPLLLLSFAGIMLCNQSLTMGGTPTYYGWAFAGFCLAANRLGTRVTNVPAAFGVEAQPVLALEKNSSSTQRADGLP